MRGKPFFSGSFYLTVELMRTSLFFLQYSETLTKSLKLYAQNMIKCYYQKITSWKRLFGKDAARVIDNNNGEGVLL